MKLAIIGTRGYPYVYSGYETFVSELAVRLVADNIKVTVYCHKNLFSDRPKEVNGIRLKYFPTVETKSLSQLIHSFQCMIHACLSSFDIILVVNSANGPFGLISRIFGKRTAINVDGLEWLRPKWKGLGAKYFYLASKVATKLYDFIINDSEAMREFYLREFQVDSTVIAYGANIRHSKRPELIQKWGLASREYYLIVGRLIPDNNADVIVAEFVKSTTQKKLVIVGDVPYEDEYANKIKSTNDERVIFTGYVRDQELLAELYHNCFAYFHGHQYGGTNPTLLKALAYGSAVLALDTVFTQEMLKQGEYGAFFTKNAGDLQKKIEEYDVSEEMLEDYRTKSRERIVQNYTWEKITEEYIALFNKMMVK